MRTARGVPTPLLCRNSNDLSNHLLLGPARDDPFRALRADAGHLTQTTRLLLDDVEHGFAERAYELLRIDRPDTADHPRAEIFLDALHRGRRCCLQERGFELDPVRTVVDPGSTCLGYMEGDCCRFGSSTRASSVSYGRLVPAKSLLSGDLIGECDTLWW
jgi:hypothetical protein